ncbi:MAG: ATP-binding protein [Chloroflexota bacterium]
MAKLSIFQTLKDRIGNDLPIIQLTKATLVHLSHTLEDFVLQKQVPAMLFTGFQESSHWRKETERYQTLADSNMQVCIFAGKPLPADSAAGAIQIELDGDDPLRQEWFVAILSADFSVILCGLDNLAPAKTEAHRKFDTVWSFDVEIVNRVLDVLEDVVQSYRPKVLAQLQEARHKLPVTYPDPDILTRFTTELLRFEDTLQDELLSTARDLEISEALYRTMATNAPVVLLMLSADGQVLLATGTRSYRLFEGGMPRIGQSVFEVLKDYPQVTEALRDALKHEQTSITLFARDSAYELRTHAIYEDGERSSVICIFIDITERVERERERLEREKLEVELRKERELSEIRRKLMMTLSHELRNPLASIRSASDLLHDYHDRLTPEKRQQRLVSMQEQTAHLTQILDDIDMVVRNDNSGFVFKYNPVDMVQFARQAVHDLNQKYNNPVRLSCEPDAHVIVTDERWLKYIVGNLLTNAARYSPQGTAIDLLISYQRGEYVMHVLDSGIGIPQDELSNLFQPFYRAANVRTINGTGLGLVIVRNIVEAMGGTISLDSRLNAGTVVTVELPAQGA